MHPTNTSRLTLAPTGNGTHVTLSRHALPGDGPPPAMGAQPYTLAEPTSDGMTRTVMRGWQTGHVGAYVYVEIECPALARYLEALQHSAVADEPRPHSPSRCEQNSMRCASSTRTSTFEGPSCHTSRSPLCAAPACALKCVSMGTYWLTSSPARTAAKYTSPKDRLSTVQSGRMTSFGRRVQTRRHLSGHLCPKPKAADG